MEGHCYTFSSVHAFRSFLQNGQYLVLCNGLTIAQWNVFEKDLYNDLDLDCKTLLILICFSFLFIFIFTGVAAYVGWQSSSILKPLLQQGLSDVEEFVIFKALNALTCMCQLGLLQKPHIYEFSCDIGRIKKYYNFYLEMFQLI